MSCALYIFHVFLRQGITLLSFVIVGNMGQILGRGSFLPPHPSVSSPKKTYTEQGYPLLKSNILALMFMCLGKKYNSSFLTAIPETFVLFFLTDRAKLSGLIIFNNAARLGHHSKKCQSTLHFTLFVAYYQLI